MLGDSLSEGQHVLSQHGDLLIPLSSSINSLPQVRSHPHSLELEALSAPLSLLGLAPAPSTTRPPLLLPRTLGLSQREAELL